MSITPPSDFLSGNSKNTGGSTNIDAVPPIFYDPISGNLAIADATALVSGVVNLVDQTLGNGTKTMERVKVIQTTPIDATELVTLGYINNRLAGLTWIVPVINFWLFDPITPVYPALPANGDRYIAENTDLLWVKNRIYQYNLSTLSWAETIPIEGFCVYVDGENITYIFTATDWVRWGITISHLDLSNIGTNTHSQIDTYFSTQFQNVATTASPDFIGLSVDTATVHNNGRIKFNLSSGSNGYIYGNSQTLGISSNGYYVNGPGWSDLQVTSKTCGVCVCDGDMEIFMSDIAGNAPVDRLQFYYNYGNILFDLDASNYSTASLVLSGGLGVAKKIYTNDLISGLGLISTSVVAADSLGNGSIKSASGGLYCANAYIAGILTTTGAINGNTTLETTTSPTFADITVDTNKSVKTHINDGTIHFTVGNISHTAITNIGNNTHATIDTFITNTGYIDSTIISLLSYGASPLGVLDCTVAVNNWLTYITTIPNTIGYIPSGKYALKSSNITIIGTLMTDRGIHIYGDGMMKSQLIFDSGFYLQIGQEISIGNLNFHDFAIIQNVGITANPAFIIGNPNYLFQVYDSTFSRLYISNLSTNSSNSCLILNNVKNCKFDNISLIETTGQAYGAGLKLNQCVSCVFNNIRALYCGNGILFYAQTGNGNNGCVFNGSDIQNCTIGINSVAGLDKNISIYGGSISTSSTWDLSLTQGQGNSVVFGTNLNTAGKEANINALYWCVICFNKRIGTYYLPAINCSLTSTVTTLNTDAINVSDNKVLMIGSGVNNTTGYISMKFNSTYATIDPGASGSLGITTGNGAGGSAITLNCKPLNITGVASYLNLSSTVEAGSSLGSIVSQGGAYLAKALIVNSATDASAYNVAAEVITGGLSVNKNIQCGKSTQTFGIKFNETGSFLNYYEEYTDSTSIWSSGTGAPLVIMNLARVGKVITASFHQLVVVNGNAPIQSPLLTPIIPVSFRPTNGCDCSVTVTSGNNQSDGRCVISASGYVTFYRAFPTTNFGNNCGVGDIQGLSYTACVVSYLK